ncbi:hypothetical protein BJ875DRAFT_546827 [Amylocarpus encephaloides]|uniref:Uncharacterized protein n=1 Tax=Amylocarpus encephaloides TaxID=45428 RepID=A0A9P7YAQ9_9HELO|nr:hypothetical protein BJ875DRAFT_546827 [Amylocarpus encephaloides]
MAAQSSFTVPSSEELLALACSGQENFVPAAEEAHMGLPHSFLSLAPATSASYPPPRKTSSSSQAPAQGEKAEDATITLEAAPAQTMGHTMLSARRSSSIDSDTSAGASPSQRKRFLKLGPVHHGEDNDGTGDWGEVVIG